MTLGYETAVDIADKIIDHLRRRNPFGIPRLAHTRTKLFERCRGAQRASRQHDSDSPERGEAQSQVLKAKSLRMQATPVYLSSQLHTTLPLIALKFIEFDI